MNPGEMYILKPLMDIIYGSEVLLYIIDYTGLFNRKNEFDPL
jgi:hypothetical protein